MSGPGGPPVVVAGAGPSAFSLIGSGNGPGFGAGSLLRVGAVESEVGGAFSSLIGGVETGAWEPVAGAGVAACASSRCFSCSVERAECQQETIPACMERNRGR
jgi:hypothetical protein